MRLVALIAATFCSVAIPCLAQNAPPMSVTQVAFSLPEVSLKTVMAEGFPTDGNRDLPFEMGSAEGSGFKEVTVPKVRKAAAVRLSAQRSRKAFGVPWQTGVFQ